MTRETNWREALVADAIGELARLLDRIEVLIPSVDRTRGAIEAANSNLAAQLEAFEQRISDMTETARGKVVQHVVQRIEQASTAAFERERQAMAIAASAAFANEVEPAFRKLSVALHQQVHALSRPGLTWLSHGATALASCLLTWAFIHAMAP